jgi:hypothetical protein
MTDQLVLPDDLPPELKEELLELQKKVGKLEEKLRTLVERRQE